MVGLFIALGGAECVWDDLAAIRQMLPKESAVHYGAVNEAGCHFNERLKIWATLHPEKFDKWQRQRAGNDDYIAVSHKKIAMNRVDKIVPELWNGSSGLYLAQVALRTYDYKGVIMCGIPMDERPHYFDKKAWEVCKTYQRNWKRKAGSEQDFLQNARSMSGWSSGMLGKPDEEWLAKRA